MMTSLARLLREGLFRLHRRWQARTLCKASAGTLAVGYLSRAFPEGPGWCSESARGGEVKLSLLEQQLPHAFPEVSHLYRVSSVTVHGAAEVCALARARGVPVVTNQNGIYYPAWFSGDVARENRTLSRWLERSDAIIFQSEFCQRAAREWLSVPDVPHTIIHNPVDTERFVPTSSPNLTRPAILTLFGSGNRFYRSEAALNGALPFLLTERDVVLRYIGTPLSRASEQEQHALRNTLVKAGGKPHQLEFSPEFSRRNAPILFQGGAVFLHLAFQDPSPNVIGEALSSGLPIVASASGGVPELVGSAGTLLPVQESWTTIATPRVDDIANGLTEVFRDYERLSRLARQQALMLLAVERIVALHRRFLAEVG